MRRAAALAWDRFNYRIADAFVDVGFEIVPGFLYSFGQIICRRKADRTVSAVSDRLKKILDIREMFRRTLSIFDFLKKLSYSFESDLAWYALAAALGEALSCVGRAHVDRTVSRRSNVASTDTVVQ
jgi:hypothetical protein